MLPRRDFLRLTAAGLAGLACAGLDRSGNAVGLAQEAGAELPIQLQTDPETMFPRVSLTGTPYSRGSQIGRAFGRNFRLAIDRRADWFKPLADYAANEGRKNVEAMLAAAEKHTPEAVEELRGWAAGAGMEFSELFVFNCKSEIEAFLDVRCGCAGCSTVVVKTAERLLVAHNEDGHTSTEDLMFLVQFENAARTAALGLAYPGVMEGNAPWVNSHGIVMTTNYIPSAKVVPGIPRYFLDRMAMEASTANAAIDIVSHSERAYGYHHVVACLPDRKAWSVEATPEKLEVHEIEGLFLHTNHLVWPGMKDLPQFEKYIALSSVPRLESLRKNLGAIPEARDISADKVLAALSCHDGRPYSVCRHAQGEATGATLGTAFFESPAHDGQTNPSVRFFRNQPCLGKSRVFQI